MSLEGLWPGVTVQALRLLALDLGAALRTLPNAEGTGANQDATDAHHERMLLLAQHDVIIHGLGWLPSLENIGQLEPGQRAGLARAALVQALWTMGAATTHGHEWIGPPRIASQSSHEGQALTFSRDARPRFSPAAAEQLLLLDLRRRVPIAIEPTT